MIFCQLPFVTPFPPHHKGNMPIYVHGHSDYFRVSCTLSELSTCCFASPDKVTSFRSQWGHDCTHFRSVCYCCVCQAWHCVRRVSPGRSMMMIMMTRLTPHHLIPQLHWWIPQQKVPPHGSPEGSPEGSPDGSPFLSWINTFILEIHVYNNHTLYHSCNISQKYFSSFINLFNSLPF